MRYNTLQLVNKVLNALDLDTVSTLGETEDAEQVLDIVDRVITQVDLDKNWFPRKTVVRLNTSTGTAYDSTTDSWDTSYPAIPWVMAIPDNVEAIYKVYYNDKQLTYLSPDDFLDKIAKGTAFVTTQMPRYWTSGLKDENYILLDSYDSTIESYLSSSRSLIHCVKYPNTQVSSDTDTTDLSDKYLNIIVHLSIMYGFYEVNHDVGMGDRYKNMSENLVSKLLDQNKRIRKFSVHPGDADFSRKRGRGIFIDSSEYTDLSS